MDPSILWTCAGIAALLGLSAFFSGSETALTAIRVLASVGPMIFLLLGAWAALSYPLTRDRHAGIRARLDERVG